MNRQKSFVVRKADIAKTLKTKPVDGKRLLEPLKAIAAAHALPFNVLEDKNVSNDAEVHKHEGDLWYCLSGEVTFIHGGEMVAPWVSKKPDGLLNENELKAKEIRGGTEVTLAPGDWLWIPAGVPHSHSAKGTARLVIVKIPKAGGD
ncbi:MAG: cupin domain-containing protein [Parcubacteria group bacterium]|nr:cupin domain-containing protein [Parcubacteria group bacterium]